MKLEKIAEIIGATAEGDDLQRELFRATAYADDTEEGDLCFVPDAAAAAVAIGRGAAAVVCDREVEVEKSDACVLLRVDDAGLAAMRLAGYIRDDASATCWLLGEKEMSFLRMILKDKRNVAFLSDDWQRAFTQLIESEKRLFVGSDAALFSGLRPKQGAFSAKAPGHVVSADSLFRTTFKIGKYIYQYKQMVHFHLPVLQRAVAFCEAHELAYDIDRIGYTRHFMPIFFEGEPSVQQVMTNDRVVILSDNLEDILEAKSYASNVGSWMAKTRVAVPPKTKVEGVKYPTIYHSGEELIALAGSLSYNYLFVYTEEGAVAEEVAAALAA